METSQTKLAWIAFSPKSDDLRGIKLEKPVHKSIKGLCSHLLEIGGESVAVHFDEPPKICEAILRFGEIIPSDNFKIIKGNERECHTNSAVLWSKNKKKYFIVTGFALSDDGIWRRHSWIKTNDGKVIETTIKREKYFGIILSDEGEKAFLEDFHQ